MIDYEMFFLNESHCVYRTKLKMLSGIANISFIDTGDLIETKWMTVTSK
jgi:hypothetical protein